MPGGRQWRGLGRRRIEGLKALIERESAKRLAHLGGTQPNLKAAPRRRLEIKP